RVCFGFLAVRLDGHRVCFFKSWPRRQSGKVSFFSKKNRNAKLALAGPPPPVSQLSVERDGPGFHLLGDTHEFQAVFQTLSTTIKAKPSYPLPPTVCTAVALTRGSAATRSLKRRMPCTIASVVLGSATAPLRTPLSATITVP